MYFKNVKRNIQCTLCPHLCILHEGEVGRCGVRGNVGGRIRSRIYGMVSGYAFDPIEKKPLYHFYPGKKILSVGSFGCNLNCNFCQNWEISLACSLENLSGEIKTIEEIIEDALSIPENIGIAYTYNEPTVWFEFMHDIAKQSSIKGLKNVMVSNGYINKEPLEELINVMDAFNIDLKGYSESFYHEMVGGKLNPVLDSLKTIRKNKKHLEITNLVIPRKNDDLDLFKEMVSWIQSELGQDTVLHLSRYFPKYKQSLPSTPESTLLKMAEIARTKLNYVYLGNINLDNYSNTYCPHCSAELILRNGYATQILSNYANGSCSKCQSKIAIVDS